CPAWLSGFASNSQAPRRNSSSSSPSRASGSRSSEERRQTMSELEVDEWNGLRRRKPDQHQQQHRRRGGEGAGVGRCQPLLDSGTVRKPLPGERRDQEQRRASHRPPVQFFLGQIRELLQYRHAGREVGAAEEYPGEANEIESDDPAHETKRESLALEQRGVLVERALRRQVQAMQSAP